MRGSASALAHVGCKLCPLCGGGQIPAPWAAAMEESLASRFFPSSSAAQKVAFR